MGERECEVVNRWGNSAGLNHKYLGQRQADKNSTVMPCLKTLRKQKLVWGGKRIAQWVKHSFKGPTFIQFPAPNSISQLLRF